MTVAERMRGLAEQAWVAHAEERAKEHKKYVSHLIVAKIQPKALKGDTIVNIKVGKKYSATLVHEGLVDKGFEVKNTSKNGRTILTVKW